MHDTDAINQLIAEVLDGTELRLRVDAYRLEEDLKSDRVRLHCDVHDRRTGERHALDSEGAGVIDAFYRGLTQLYATPFPSLQTLRFADFAVRAKLDTGHVTARTDSTADTILRVANSDGQEVMFTHSSPSITRSSIEVVLQCIEFFINSERAFIEVYKALQQARADNRPDSIEHYTRQLAVLVQATSYSEVIDHMKAAEFEARRA